MLPLVTTDDSTRTLQVARCQQGYHVDVFGTDVAETRQLQVVLRRVGEVIDAVTVRLAVEQAHSWLTLLSPSVTRHVADVYVSLHIAAAEHEMKHALR